MRLSLVVFLTGGALWAHGPALVERVGATGFIQLTADSFSQLSPRQQALTYSLSQASIAIDPIIYDQNSRFGLRQKRLLEGVVGKASSPHVAGLNATPKIVAFTKLFWANRGNHNENTAQKMLPDFPFEELHRAATEALRDGAFQSASYGTPPIHNQADLDRELADLRPSLFDPAFEPTITTKSPRGNLDILQASANNFYSGVSLPDLKGFTEMYRLNSRLVKEANGKLVEQMYRAGTPDGKVAPGFYSQFLGKAIGYLQKAREYAEPGQEPVINALIRYSRLEIRRTGSGSV